MSIDIQKQESEIRTQVGPQRKILVGLSLMLSGRAMTLAYIGRAGGGELGDPPIAWLMPLIGDAVIGLAALAAVYAVLRGRSWRAWTFVVVFNALAIWDAMSAFAVHLTTPWPEFFMVQLFGSSMFFMASAMHLVCLLIIVRPAMRRAYGMA